MATGELFAWVKPPAPSPRNTLTLPPMKLSAAKSGLPSLLKSPTATDLGVWATITGEPGAGVKPPMPSPSRIVTLSDELLTTARSGFVSRLKSPVTIWLGAVPAANGDPAGWVKNAAFAGAAARTIVTTDASATGRTRLMARHYAQGSGRDSR